MPQKPSNAYDEAPYPCHPSAWTHPAHLGVHASLAGLEPVSPAACRCLELGCATGANLIPLAVQFPESEFVGIDLSAVQIRTGQEIIEALGLKNIRLMQGDIAGCGKQYGAFDYIIAHGVFSWVPPEVQESILAVCARSLTENGIGYIDYNTYPGWHQRGVVRDMMCYHTAHIEDPAARASEALRLVDFVAKCSVGDTESYRAGLRQELRFIADKAPGYVLHEFLEEHNSALYFHEFVSRACAHGLRYLADSRCDIPPAARLSPPVRQFLGGWQGDAVRQGQYFDFLGNRSFRRSILCRGDAAISRTRVQGCVKNFYVSSLVKPHSDGAGNVLFVDLQGRALPAVDGHLRAVMLKIAEQGPACLSYESVLRLVENDAALKAPDLPAVLLEGFYNDLLSLFTVDLKISGVIAERPQTTPLARLQASRKQPVTTLRHRAAALGPLECEVLALLDGRLSRAQLSERLGVAGAEGRDGERLQVVSAMLERFSEMGLLLGESDNSLRRDL